MFWFRMQNPSVVDQQTLFQIPQGPQCYLTATEMLCNTGQVLALNTFPNLQQWMHLTYTTNRAANSSLLQINYPLSSSTANGTYLSINSNQVFLGIDSQQTKLRGIRGDVRDFYMNVGQINLAVVPLIFHMKKVFEMSCMGYYEFDPLIGYLKDTFRNQQAVSFGVQGSNAPLFLSEQITSPQCSTLDSNTFDQLPSFQPSYSAPSISIPNFKGLQTGYSYTMSLWFRNGGGQNTASNSVDGLLQSSFVSLPGVFTLWFDSATSFKVFVNAQNNINSFTSPSVFVPLNEWVNIQLALSAKSGISVSVFNSNGAQLQSMSVSNSLGAQSPAGTITLFQNFDGAVKNFQLWEQLFTLPLTNAGSQTNLRLSFDFSQSYFSSSQWFSFPLGGSALASTVGQGFYFSQMRVPNVQAVSFSNPSKMGTISAQSTLWDGLGCMQSYKYNNFYGTLQQSVLLSASGSLTAEIWFSLQNSTTKASFINLVNLQTGGQASLSIYIINGTLICAPFGLNDTSSILTFTGVNPLNQTSWQHVSCGFTQNQRVFGQYLLYNPTRSNSMKSLLPQTFAKSLASSIAVTPNQLQPQQAIVTVGSNSLNMNLKEIRIWNTLRNMEQTFSNRFKQVDSTDPSLQLNYKLISGNLTVINEAISGGTATASQIIGNTIAANQTALVICPMDTYFDFRVMGCVSYPFDLLKITYATQQSLQNGFQQVYSNQYLQSAILLPLVVPQTNQSWSLSDTAIDRSFVSLQRNQVQLLMNPVTLGDGYEYTLTSIQTDSNNYFWLNTNQQIYPRQCFYLADKLSKTSVNSVTINTASLNASSQTCFNLQVFTVDGCYQNFYDILLPQGLVSSSPPVAGLQGNFTVNPLTKMVSVCFTQAAILSLPPNQRTNLIVSVFWATDQEQNVNSQSYIDAVYQVSIVHPINVTVVAQSLYQNQQDIVRLDASGSANSDNSTNGLVFNWLCPQGLQLLCSISQGSPVLEITNSMLMSLQGNKTQDYEFTVQVWSLSFGMSVGQQSRNFSRSISVNWSKLVVPRFNINVGQGIGQTTPQIVATQDSSARLQIFNYRSTDPNLQITWTVTPASAVNTAFMVKSPDGSVLYLRQGALQQNTSYSLNVSVAIKQGQTGFLVLAFQTGISPAQGTFSASPTSGIMFLTQFQVSLSNWQSNAASPLKATIWGLTSMVPLQRIQVSQSLLPFGSSGNFTLTTILPQIVGLQLEVYNQLGERTIQTLNISSSRSSGSISWSKITSGVIISSSSLSKSQQYYYLSSIARSCANDFASNLTTANDCISSSNLMLLWATPDLAKIQPNDNSTNATNFLSSFTSMIAQISMKPATMDGNSSLGVYNAISTISTKTAPFLICLTDTHFQSNFAQSIQNLVQYQSQLTSPNYIGRRLQQNPQSIINGLIVQKNLLLDQLCLVATQNSVNVTGLYLATYEYDVTDSIQDVVIYSQQRANTSIVVPVDKILSASVKNDPLVSTVCLQTSFMMQNPIPSYLFVNTTIFSNDSFIQVSTLDDQGHRLLNTKGVSNLALAPFQLNFNYNFNDVSFIDGQTTCLGYNSNTLPSPWNSSLCNTTYLPNQIVCSCDQINNFFYAVGNDFTLHPVLWSWTFTYQWCWPFLIIIFPLALLVFLMPCAALYLDKKDYQAVQDDEFKVSEQLLNYVCVQRKYNYEQELFYKLKDIEIMQKWSSFSFFGAYQIIRLNVHPVWSLLWRFDFGIKRLMRVAMILIQVSLITLAIFAIYSKGKYTISAASPYIITFVLGLISLAPPERVMTCFKTRMIVIQKTAETAQQPAAEEEIVLKDNSCVCKFLVFFFSILFQFLALAICACFAAGAENKHVSFRVSIDVGREVVIVWFCTLIWGYLILNEIKVLFVTIVSYSQAKNMLKEGDKWANNSLFWSCLKRLNPQTSIDLCLDALYVVQYKSKDIEQINRQLPYTTGFDQSMDGKHMNAVNNTSSQQNTIIPEGTELTDRKHLKLQKNEVSFSENEHNQDDDQNQYELKDDDNYSDEEVPLPQSARANPSSFAPPISNPLPRTRVEFTSSEYNTQQTSDKGRINNELTIQERHQDRDYYDDEYQETPEDDLEVKPQRVHEIQVDDVDDKPKKVKKDKKDKKNKKEKKHKKDKKSKKEMVSDDEVQDLSF